MLVQSVCGTSYKFANFFLFCYAHIYFFIYHFSEMISSFTIACVFTLVLLVTNASTHPILSNLFFQGKFFSYKSFHHCWLDSLTASDKFCRNVIKVQSIALAGFLKDLFQPWRVKPSIGVPKWESKIQCPLPQSFIIYELWI